MKKIKKWGDFFSNSTNKIPEAAPGSLDYISQYPTIAL